jgi:CubicO group peptidase (beta-lactamase class C family)
MPQHKKRNGVRRILEEGVKSGVFPGAVAALVEGDRVVTYVVVGNRSVVPHVEPMDEETIFDLASLTKVVATSTLLMLMVRNGMVSLDDEVHRFLPDFTRRGITLMHLATHTSGLPAWRPLYAELRDPDELITHLASIPLGYPTGSKVVYSCLGYILLGKVLERIGGDRLDRLADEMIFKRLSMRDTIFNPSPELRERCAPTESGESMQRRRPGYRRASMRDEEGWVIRGEVHDENAYFLGGVAGNAGLFSTARDLVRFCMGLFDGELLDGETLEVYSGCNTPGLNESRGIGWIVLPDGSLYHTGFTGTSIRVDLKRKMAGILLTNRVHPDALGEGITQMRWKFYQEVFE